MTEPAHDLAALIEAARAVRSHAYAPYSRFRVGAALRSESGRVYVGCNVENASYGATLCAERSAIAQLVAAGERRVSTVVVFTDADEPAMPCGMCRQVLLEFAEEARVVVTNGNIVRETSLAALVPHPFRLTPPE